jgi:biofilm PGA synthesis N-glycosyltransferase PgaC
MTEAIYFTFLALLVLPALDYFLALYILPDVKTSTDSVDFPIAVSAIIACHNEELHIERKVREVAAQFVDAGVTEFEIIVVSDGSIDNSDTILQGLDSEGVVNFIKLDARGGKPGALNRGIAISQHPILLFSDVRQTFSHGATKSLLSHLTDPKIGAATSQLELSGDTSPTRKWMNSLKLRESRKGSTTGMCGALYVVPLTPS